ncbi:MAG: hypothetical protein K9N55_11045 [Phycisphaerae bacterium]|nr:hypothetical protein [Phycisphaerae bacterium]
MSHGQHGFLRVGGVLLLIVCLAAQARAGLGRTPMVRQAAPVRVEPAPMNPARVTASLRLPVELKVGMTLLATANQTPYKNGEIQIPFGSQMTIDETRRGSAHLYVPFRWQTASSHVTAAQWQVVLTPLAYDSDNWEYPAGIAARGTATVIAGANQPAYFVVDFGPILKLPPEYRLTPPAPRRRASRSRQSTGMSGASGLRLSNLGTGAQAVRVSPALQAQRSTFVQQLETLSQHRAYYLRLVLLNSRGEPVGVSSYAAVRTAAPGHVTIFPGSLPEAQQPIHMPEVKVLGYEHAIEYSPDDRQGRFIVLSNCPKFLMTSMKWTPGQAVHFEPHEDSGLEQVAEAAGDAIDAVSDLINWVSKTWSDMQAEFVNGICNGNDTCKSCAGPALKMGLAAVGIPPELPNTNDLCSMGRDYVVAYIASQTPVPEELINAGIDKMADVVNNPPGGQGAAFLWPDPRFQDKQAFIEVEITNTTAQPTASSVLWLLYGSTIGDTTTYPAQIPPWLDTRTPIPPLQPGQSLRFPIFLTRNPEALISHGSDRLSTYMDRRVEIRDKGGKVLFTGKTNWWGLNM